MNAHALMNGEGRHWSVAGALALGVHLGVALLVLGGAKPAPPPLVQPVVLVELPPLAASTAPAPASAARPSAEQPRQDMAPPLAEMPPVRIAPVRAPLLSQPVTLPPPSSALAASPQPAAQAAATQVASQAAPSENGSGQAADAGAPAGQDPRARRAEADYFSLVSAHLNRRKIYPAEARKARQQGVVMVRFTVGRSGQVAGVSIKRSSGHAILDQATLDLLQRVAPLPRMPASMPRDSITLALPIDYALRTN